jgi:hypothetical protein
MPKMPGTVKWIRSVGMVGLALLAVTVIRSQQLRNLSGRAASYNPNCAVDDQPCMAWAQFRAVHAYPYQAIQWKELADHRVAVMLLEPPPVMTKAQLEALVRVAFSDDLRSFDRFRWKMGIDGWLEDSVLTVAAPKGETGSDPLRDRVLRDKIAFLHLALFGTVFGATFDQQKYGSVAPPSDAAPNLQINPGEVRQWMTDPLIRWQAISDPPGAQFTWQNITSTHKSGAFIASDRRLVVLTFPVEILKKGLDDENELNLLRIPFRCFAIATDSIAGAFQAPNGQVAILGRPRTQSVAAVPPLRFETFRMLATQTQDELSQSYERRSLFAGKMHTGEFSLRDWAPIYLSDALIDTEFGALLNTTDQLLKSWSEAGHIEYLYFNYPKPGTGFYPFTTPLSERVIKESGNVSVLYNWNTSGSTVFVNTLAGKALATHQTGALPVTYGAGVHSAQSAALLEDEETAYGYFAGRKDPNLERVVQYTVLYQLFRAINGGDTKNANPLDSRVPPGQERAVRARHEAAAVRVTATLKLLAGVEAGRIRMEPLAKEELSAKLRRFRQDNPDLASDAKVANLVADRFSDESKAYMMGRNEMLRSRNAEIDQLIGQYNTDIMLQRFLTKEQLAGLPARKKEIEQKELAFERLRLNSPIDDVRNILVRVAAGQPNLDDVRKGFVDSFNYEPAGSIKTPSIVISWDSTEFLVGGHNVDSRVLKFEVSDSVTGISIEDTPKGPVVRYNPSKASLVEGHATELARAVEHRHVNGTADLEKIASTPIPSRSRTVALQLPKTVPAGSPSDGWSARLGSHLYTQKTDFVGHLSTLAEKSACCEYVGYDDSGIAFATERNLKPPPASMIYELRDTPSLSSYVDGAAKKGRPLIFLDTPEDHVEALSLQATLGKTNGQNLNDMAKWLGKQRSDIEPVRLDGIATADLNGEVGVLKTFANKAEAGARALLNRLTFREPAATWTEAQVRSLQGNEVNEFVEAIGWDAEKDGAPAAVMLKFGKANANGPPIDVSVVAGFRDADLAAGRTELGTIQQKALASAQAKRECLARYALTIKREMQQVSRVRAKRLTIVVREGKTKQLLSWLDPGETLPHATKHPG